MSPQPWHWWVLGGLLILLEVVVPGFVLLWLGFAALLTGGILWFAPALGWPWQIAAFSLSALAFLAAWFAWRRRRPPTSDEPFLNRRAQSYIGETVVLVEAIRDGRGKAKVGDTVWPVRGDNLVAGTRVRVVGVHGGALLVEPVEEPP